MMDRLGIEENEPITHPWISRAIENAQKRVEGHNFEIRKHLLEYDDVMNQQRKTVYGMRREYLAGADTRDKILDMIDGVVTNVVDEFLPEKTRNEEIDLGPIEEKILKIFDSPVDWKSMEIGEMNQGAVGKGLFDALQKIYEEREKKFSAEVMRQTEKVILLSTLDSLWKDHLLSMDHLREGIGLRGYGQKDPLLEYKREGFILFQNMIRELREDVLTRIFHIQIAEERQVAQVRMPRMSRTPLGVPMNLGRGPSPEPVHTAKVGRNDPCSCGSGKKYKKCHGV